MNKALIIAAILVVLGGGYALYKGLTRLPSVSQILPGVQVATATERENTDTYTIDVKYPQFGIASIDADIKAAVEGAVTEFKNDSNAGPPPPDSAVTQYEFQSMFDSAYVGADVVSAKLVVSTYMGGAHPNAAIYGLNYDRETGNQLTLDDALSMIGLSLEEVSERAKAELSTIEAMGGNLSLVAEFPDRKPVVLSGIAGDEPKPKPNGRRYTSAHA